MDTQDLTEKLAEAGREMAELKQQVNSVTARIERLNTQAAHALRQDVLHEAWTQLIGAADYEGARIVARMMDTSWKI